MLRINWHCPNSWQASLMLSNFTNSVILNPFGLTVHVGKITRAYLSYAQMIQFGVLVPGSVDEEIKRKRKKIDQGSYLRNLLASDPKAFFKRIYPQNHEYARLLQEKERLFAIAMGYLDRTLTDRFDADIQRAVQMFQLDNGMAGDGIVGDGTRAGLNKSPEDRLAAILVAMERERWTNFERGRRHVLVNLADFSAKIMNNGRIEFQTRSVIGTNKDDQRSPEFSDEIEHMAQCIRVGEIYVSQPSQYLLARYPIQKFVRPRSACVQPWMYSFTRSL